MTATPRTALLRANHNRISKGHHQTQHATPGEKVGMMHAFVTDMVESGHVSSNTKGGKKGRKAAQTTGGDDARAYGWASCLPRLVVEAPPGHPLVTAGLGNASETLAAAAGGRRGGRRAPSNGRGGRRAPSNVPMVCLHGRLHSLGTSILRLCLLYRFADV